MSLIKVRPLTTNELLAHADKKRSEFRDGGTTANLGGLNILVRTDRQTRDDVIASKARAAEVEGWSVDWKLGTGTWVTINAAALDVVAAAIDARWSDAYARERQANEGVLAGTITTKAQIDALFA